MRNYSDDERREVSTGALALVILKNKKPSNEDAKFIDKLQLPKAEIVLNSRNPCEEDENLSALEVLEENPKSPEFPPAPPSNGLIAENNTNSRNPYDEDEKMPELEVLEENHAPPGFPPARAPDKVFRKRKITFVVGSSSNSRNPIKKHKKLAPIENLEGNYNRPEFPAVPALHGLIGEYCEPFEKQLTITDVDIGQCRLSISRDHVRTLIEPLINEDEHLDEGIPVSTYDLEGNEYSMDFKNLGKIIVLKKSWRKFCEDHDLRALIDFVTIRVFRHLKKGNLCFLISPSRVGKSSISSQESKGIRIG